ncbi:methyltransferase family protein [Haloplanus sp. C73]|uniref:methyltransferase family protein n=1 Tax=Haloplanus sp. C73 TaxID=3421641 RepID=UPI003EBF5D08
MTLGYGLAFVGIGVFIQGWRQVHQARQDDQLVTNSLYSVVRHPQYTGLFIALFGEGIIHWPTIFSVGLFPVIVLTFTWLARKEEHEMSAQFGDRYRTYKQDVPMFVPHIGQWRRFLNESRSGPNQ